MARHSSRLPRLFQWQYIRWGLAFPTFALALWACNSHDLQVPKPNPQQETDFEILVSPERSVDILFVIDNSPSMDPKQQALAQNFPKMIEALQKLEGGLPDIHVGVVSSDMGAGGGEAGGNCGIVLGNQGILWGNDPNQDPGNANNKFATIKNISNGCGMNSGARWVSDIQNNDGLTRTKNYQGNLTDVFSCLAKAVGVNGCGYEHSLQSLRVALNPQKDVNYEQNTGFLRRRAYMAVVVIADEDDCSANPNNDTNDGMFGPRTLGDTASLRCATRGHVCNNQDIPTYDPAAGYQSKEPFSTALANCDAKDDTGDPRDYKKLPLIRIRDMIDSVNGVKDRPAEQILVSGIIGWPDQGKLDGVEYKIDKDTTSMPVEQQKLWDYMPICKLPQEKAADGNIYKAYAGLRLKKFIDGFGENGQIFSICKIDNFPDAMKQIGDAIVRKLKPGCVGYPLIDAQPNVPDVQPECQVKDRLACDTPGQPDPKTGLDCLPTGFTEKALSQCVDGDGNTLAPTKTKQQFEKEVPDDDAHRPCWFLIYDKDENAGCPKAFKNQKITALRKGNGNAPPGTLLGMQCLTCATPPVGTESSCPALGTM
jgi:hypothetical protein